MLDRIGLFVLGESKVVYVYRNTKIARSQILIVCKGGIKLAIKWFMNKGIVN